IGLPKVLIAAREIAEIDPFIDIEIYPEGINEGNIDAFLSEQGKLDILIDECDSLDIKVLLRERAKQLQVPVIMETNDRCMVDIERFDQEHDRSIFHGVLGGDFDSSHLSQLTTREKIPFALKILGINQLSLRMKASLLEIENSINGWPQLASDVNMGGGVLANICRKILLGENVKSGRYYVDLDELFSIEEIADRAETALRSNSDEQTKRHPGKSDNGMPKRSIDDVLIKKIIRESLNAPSGGNLQPWEFVPYDKGVFIGINKSRISSELDPLLFGANVAIGAVAENIALTAKNYNLEAITTFSHQSANGNEFVAKIDFQKPEGDFQPSEQDRLLFNMISKRKTNRALNQQPVDKDKLLQINTFLSAEHEEQFLYVFDQEKIEAIAKLIGIADRLRMSYHNFHKELMQEICWSESEALKRRNGIYIKDLGISEDNAAINIMRDWEIMHFLKQIDKGQGTEKLSREVFQKENALGLFVTNHNSSSSFLQAGRALQKAWLYSTSLNLDWHPATSSIYFFLQLDFPEKIKLPTALVDQLKTMRAEFNELFQLNGSEGLVMLTRFVNSADSKATSLRMPLEEVYTEA
ncbi:MAG: Rv1355c family protein, partial [Mameliella sp.]|nr:Rv1355c family protein [Phaeodactylibacter sp.]